MSRAYHSSLRSSGIVVSNDITIPFFHVTSHTHSKGMYSIVNSHSSSVASTFVNVLLSVNFAQIILTLHQSISTKFQFFHCVIIFCTSFQYFGPIFRASGLQILSAILVGSR